MDVIRGFDKGEDVISIAIGSETFSVSQVLFEGVASTLIQANDGGVIIVAGVTGLAQGTDRVFV